jgi:hypothetical protein
MLACLGQATMTALGGALGLRIFPPPGGSPTRAQDQPCDCFGG